MMEKLLKASSTLAALLVPSCLFFFIGYLLLAALPALKEVGGQLFSLSGRWQPLGNKPDYNILPMVLGTLLVTLSAVLVALPVGVATAFFFRFYLPPKLASFLLTFIDLLAGVPSVIFGFLGLVVLVKNLEKLAFVQTGESVFAAILLLAVMLLPFIVSTIYESLVQSKKRYYQTAISLGIDKRHIMRGLIFPSIKESVLVAFMLASSRALGETMAVMMVIGNSPLFPRLFGRAQTISSLTALEMGSAGFGSLHLSAIYLANLILLLLLILLLSLTNLLKKQVEPNA